MWQRRSRAALIGVLGIIALTPAGAGADPVLPFSVYGHYFFGGEFDAGFVTAGSRRYFGPNHDTLLTLPAVNTGGIGGAGSELNIQLSGSAAPGTLRAFAQVTADSSTVLTDGRSWGTAAVSYTHLTLPTTERV